MPNPTKAQLLARYADMDLRRQRQIANQVETINRLLNDPDAAQEIARLHARIAELEQP